MIFTETELPGAWIVEPERIEDERGFFARTFDAAEFCRRGLRDAFPECSVSYNARAATLRGMHFQAEPHAEAKLVRCTAGAIVDVVIDLRPGSPTHGRWTAVELSAQNRRALYVPEGFAHGFQTLVDATEVFYQISTAYHAASSRGVRWDDPAFGIRWPAAEARVISARDRAYPDYTP
ncbi:MAG TPA: dTDP-4-dehydrorhamnose 3,5-epimerase [Longimicrobium sp.]|uniref:dTDP-4-dehydrorhamnose 3,5-epimerase n=1 Tax=Longimicrobium sp. TaxID=2029185 RepID=UPI002ED9E79E